MGKRAAGRADGAYTIELILILFLDLIFIIICLFSCFDCRHEDNCDENLVLMFHAFFKIWLNNENVMAKRLTYV